MSVVQTLADGSNKGKTEKRRAPSGKGKVIDLVLPVIFLIVTVELCSTLNKIRRSSRTGLENLSRTLARDGGT